MNVARAMRVDSVVQNRGASIVTTRESMNCMHLDLMMLKVIEDMTIVLHSSMKICLKQL